VTALGAASPPAPMLSVEGLDVAYGDFQVLWQAAMHVDEGEIVAVLGPNGAGKSTLMNSISGLIAPRAGRITFLGKRIDGLPAHRTAGEGLAHVLERRRLFPFLTVLDNLLLGAHNPAARSHRAESLAQVQRLFPVIGARGAQLAHTLSGGEQQMVAIARALMTAPRLILLDEPSLGLSPKFVTLIFEKLVELREAGYTLMLVEQNATRALAIADRGYVLETGRIAHAGTGAALLADARVRQAYLGI
jgi:branched-chain amino acid transport system ATP-binding protein